MSVRRNIRWSGATTALAAVLAVNGTTAADRSIHEIQIAASRHAFEPVTIQVNAGEPVRIVIRSNDGVHGFSIPKLKIDVQVPKSGDPATVEFTAPPAGGRPRNRLFVAPVFRVTVSDLRILRSSTQGTEV